MSFSIITTHSVDEVAAFLKKSKSTIYSDASRRPETLPPQFRVPGSSKLLFANLYLWASKLIREANKSVAPATPQAPSFSTKRKRGRPSNIDVQRRKWDGQEGRK